MQAVVETFELREALNAPYELEIDLHLVGYTGDIVLDLLGKECAFEVRRRQADASTRRRVKGLIMGVQEGRASLAGQLPLHLSVRPALSMLGLRRDTRILENKTVPEILAAVLDPLLLGYGRSMISKLGDGYAKREYCVQYQNRRGWSSTTATRATCRATARSRSCSCSITTSHPPTRVGSTSWCGRTTTP